MRLTFRVLAVLVAVPATYYFIYWVSFGFVSSVGSPWMHSVFALSCAAGVGLYIWKQFGYASPGLMSSAMTGAVALGVIGFLAGFVGPMILAPEANQGPLLGIFITGPLGFLGGAVGDAVYWQLRGRKAATG